MNAPGGKKAVDEEAVGVRGEETEEGWR